MRSALASVILAFCAIVAVHAAPAQGNFALAARDNDFQYDADGNELDTQGNVVDKRDNDFEYDADGNELDAQGNVVDKRDNDFEYDADGNEIDEDGELVE